MLSRIFSICVTLMVCVSTLDAGFWDNLQKAFSGNIQQKPKMRVLILHDVPNISLEVKGKYKLFDPNTNEHISTRFVGKKKQMELMSGGIKWGEEFPGLHQIAITPEEGYVWVDNTPYSGTVYVYDIGGGISVINELDLDDYLASTLPKQANPDWLEETYAAYIILARTNAYYNYLNPKTPFWNVDAKAVGFEGASGGYPAQEIMSALSLTRGMVLSSTGHYEGKITPFLAQWTASEKGLRNIAIAKISLDQANDLAKKGEHAAQILSKAFPETSIQLIGQ